MISDDYHSHFKSMFGTNGLKQKYSHDINHMRNILTCNIIQHFSALLILIFPLPLIHALLNACLQLPYTQQKELQQSIKMWAGQSYLASMKIIKVFYIVCLCGAFKIRNCMSACWSLLLICCWLFVEIKQFLVSRVAGNVAHCHFVTSFLPC